MIILDTKAKGFAESLEGMLKRDAFSGDVETKTAKVLADIRVNGDNAIIKYAKQFDKAEFKSASEFKVTRAEITAAMRQVSKADRDAIKQMIEAVAVFAKCRKPRSWKTKVRRGVILGERFVPMDRVGVYIPGGTAPLVSTVAHTATIAKAAGVREVVAVTPPRADGSVNPHILCALKYAGVKEIYRLGGIYAIGALAYGTPTIPKVEKIVGPGNAWVTAAKKLVYGHVAIDMVAGPSEVMVVADRSARAEWVAADLLSQLEHGGGNLAILATPDAALIEKVQGELRRQMNLLERRAMLEEGMKDGCILIKTKSLTEAAAVASNVAPEHLELQVEEPEKLLKKITAAGAVFLGEWTPEPVGDFVAGPSHVLPTAGSARYFSGLATDAFYRRMSTLSYTERALRRELPTIERIADMELLDAHKRSAAIRIKGDES